MKVGIVDVGGGYRGVYAAGVLDYCYDHGITFDLGIGVSAGSANLGSFVAGQPRRNFQFYTEYGARKEYAGIGNFLKKRTFIDMDYVYETLSSSDGEYPLNYAAFKANPMDYYVVATDAETGKARYFEKQEIHENAYDILKASCAIPFVCHPYVVDGREYFDGGISDPVPIRKAFALGCDKVILLLTLPTGEPRTSELDIRVARLIRLHYPQIAKVLYGRAQWYNDTMELAEWFARAGKLLIVAPNDTCGVTTLTRDRSDENHQQFELLYEKGYEDGEKIKKFLEY